MLITVGTIVYDSAHNPYEVIEPIGRGSFGIVFKIKRQTDDAIYALKTLPTEFLERREFDAFKHEGQLAVEINHPNVVRYLFFHTGTQYPSLPPYIIMEYAPDGTLDQLLADKRRGGGFFDNQTIIQMFEQLISGMEAVNAKLIHRDIKPDNIVLADDHLKVTDFGLAKLVQQTTRTSTFKGLGCLPFLAPEAWKSETNTIQMDIYSMGIVFYEIATLEFPYKVATGDPQLWRDAHLFHAIPRPELINPAVTPNLSQVIMRMVAKRTQNRFANWEDIKTALSTDIEPTRVDDSDLVKKAVKTRLATDAKVEAERLRRAKEEEEKHAFLKLVNNQFKNDIVEPIKSFIDTLNSEYHGEKITLTLDYLRVSMAFPSRKRVDILIEAILAENFIREREGIDALGRSYSSREVCIPHLRGQKVLAWGQLSGTDGRGFNILLLEEPGSVYGNWVVLLNTSGFFPGQVMQTRPEPFAFDLTELEQRMPAVGALGKYSTEVKPLDMAYIKEFIAGYFS